MRFRPQTWLLLSVFFFVAAFYSWQLGDEWEANRKAAHQTPKAPAQTASNAPVTKPAASANAKPLKLLTATSSPGSNPKGVAHLSRADRVKYRLTNSDRSASELARSDKAILLQNLLLDTTQPIGLPIPDDLRS